MNEVKFPVYIDGGGVTNQIKRLEQENALLWAFVRADDAMQAHDRVCDGSDPSECQRLGEAVVMARQALKDAGFPWGTEGER